MLPVSSGKQEATGERTSEIRWVSVLFVDLVGSTALAEGRTPEDVRALLSGYFDAAKVVVDRYGGEIEKFIGDAVVAVWGSKLAHDDDAERAVRAGMDLVEAVADYGERHGLSALKARAGVVTGEVATWATPGEGLVAGDRVNTAARVQTAAEPGVVYVDAMTRRASEAAIAYVAAGERQLKGKADPLELWRAQRVVANVGGSARVDGLETGFVGRGRALTVVKELMHATVDNPTARLVSVLGAAGVGKSRLGWEFEKYVDGLAAHVLWHRGRCLPYGDGVGLWAFAQIVRQRFDIAEDDSDDVADAKLADQLGTWITDPEERAFVEPRLAVLIGAGGDHTFSPDDLFAGWRLYVERLADTTPFVWLVEDGQWADPRLLDFIDHLLDWSSRSRIFILFFARPELLERRPEWAGGRSNIATVHLEPLPDEDMGQLLEGLVPGMPEHVKGRIVAQSGGVPLYAVETIRSLVDRDVVIPRDGVYQLVGDIGELDVPASLTSLITARIDALPDADRDFVKRLSVLGGTFSRDAVAALTRAPAPDVDRMLRDLVRREVLTVQADPLSPERGHYGFVQIMLRSVAMGLLSRQERKEIHLAVAEYLRSSFPDQGEEVAEVLASHTYEAYLASANDSDSDWLRGQARMAFELAGKRAAQIGAPESAFQHYLRSAELADDDAVAVLALTSAADMAHRAGKNQEALALYERARAIHEEAGDVATAAGLAARAGLVLARMGRIRESLDRQESALQVLMSLPEPSPDAEARLRFGIARALSFLARTDDAFRHVEQAAALAAQVDLGDVLGLALQLKGSLLVESQGRVVEGIALLRAAVELLETMSGTARGFDGFDIAVVRHNLADALAQSDIPGSYEQYLEAGTRWERSGSERVGIARAGLALACVLRGAWEEAESNASAAVAVARSDDVVCLSAGAAAMVAALQGKADLARRTLSEVTAPPSGEDRQLRALWGIAQATLHLAEGAPARAFESAAEAARSAYADLGMRTEGFRFGWSLAMESAVTTDNWDAAEALLGLVVGTPRGVVPPFLRAELAHYRALLNAARSEHDTVEHDLREGLEILTDLGYPYWTAKVQSDLGRWLESQGRADEAAPLLKEAARTFMELGAAPDLERRRLAPSAVGTPAPSPDDAVSAR